MGSSRTARGIARSARPGPLTRASIWLRGLRGGSKAGGNKASRSKIGGSASAGRSASAPPAKGKPAPPPARSGLSLDRKLDIIGIVLVVIGLLTLLSLVSQRNSIWTGGWVRLLGRVFGLGMYLFPLALLAGGGWLVLRNFERVPRLAAERVIGILLLFTNLLAWLHLGMATYTRLQVFDLAQAGRGGGYLGAAVIGGLEAGLGLAGAVTVLLGWLLIGLALTLDVSVLDLFGWIPPLIQRLQDGVIERVEARREGSLPARPAGDLSVDGSYYTREAPSSPEAGGLQPGGMQPMPAMRTLPEGPAYILPAIADILEPGAEVDFDDEIDRSRARVIEETLASFGAPAHVVEINRGPTITQFGVEPDFVEARGGQKVRVRVGKIASLVDDLALALSARTIRIQAPVPGKSFVGIEVPNDEIALVALRDVMESEAFKRLRSPLRFALGQNVAGNAVAADLAAMPHLLVAGATGSGKSVCVNALICDLLLNNTPDDLRLIMVDPKRVELTGYNGIPHLLAPVVVEMERVVGALGWIIREMDLRYRKLAEAGCRNIQDYNTKMPGRGVKKLPLPGDDYRRAG